MSKPLNQSELLQTIDRVLLATHARIFVDMILQMMRLSLLKTTHAQRVRAIINKTVKDDDKLNEMLTIIQTARNLPMVAISPQVAPTVLAALVALDALAQLVHDEWHRQQKQNATRPAQVDEVSAERNT